MENFHIRSNSLPSQSHPVVNDVEYHLRRLKSSEGTSTSACVDLASLRSLHEGIHNLIQMPSIQQALTTESSERWTNELLEDSLGLVDLCGFAKEVLSLSKGFIQEAQSSLRRNRDATSVADVVNVYMASRKKISKMVGKFIKKFNKNRKQLLSEEPDLEAVSQMLKETADFDFSVLKSVLMFLCGEEENSKKRSRSFLSKLTQTSRVKRMDAADLKSILKQLKSSEVAIQETEEELESYYRILLKTSVSLLNALNH